MKTKMILNLDGKKLYQIYCDEKGYLFADRNQLTSDAVSDFDAVLFKGKLQIVYKDRLHGLYHLGGSGKRMILKSKNIGKVNIQNIKLWPYRNHLLLFYVMNYQRRNMLCCQNLSRNTESPQIIDQCMTTKYDLLHTKEEGFLIVYTRQEEKRFCLRRFEGVWSAPHILDEGGSLQGTESKIMDECVILDWKEK